MFGRCIKHMTLWLAWGAMAFLLMGTAWARQPAGALHGKVFDPSGAVIPGAEIQVLNAGNKAIRKLLTDRAGNFSVAGLPTGTYTLHVSKDGFSDFVSGPVRVVASKTTRVIARLPLKPSRQEVSVMAEPNRGLSVAPGENASAITLRGADLQALPDDPDELRADLKALAGPTVNSKGAEFLVDGFHGGRLPPKDAIQEIRINQNPFSAKYSEIGFGRVEIVTKPGARKVHGTLSLKGSDAALNSRNPFTTIKPSYHAEDLTGDMTGPLSSQASYFLDFEGRKATENEIINATVLGPSLNVTSVAQSVVTPETDGTGGGRIDYQVNDKNILSARYEWNRISQNNVGVGGFTLPSRAYSMTDTTHTVQLADTMILSNSAINQTRLQYIHEGVSQNAGNFQPTLKVLGAFTGGGAQAGNAFYNDNSWELRNDTSLTHGKHTITFGGDVHTDLLYDRSPGNFAGTFIFSGGLAPVLDSSNNIVQGPDGNPLLVPLTSIQRYQRTLQLQQSGFSPAAILARGAGPSQFTIAGGRPASSLAQTDVGVYFQDDWRVTPSLSLSPGFRWEGQNDIHDWKDFGPRFGLAWAPGRHGHRGKTVIRLGSGIFYQRLNSNRMLQTLRFNGVTQQQFVLNNPLFYPQVPAISSLQALGLPQTIWTVDPNLRSPAMFQAAAGVEQQLPLGIVASVNYIHTRVWHDFLSRNINAPLPGTGKKPFQGGNIYQYESAGVFNGNQLVVSINRRFRGRFAMFGRYTYNRAFSNSGGINSFPANQYNLQADYSRASTDIRHDFVVGGSLLGPFRTDLSPFLVIRSGAPFNITTGQDNNGDSLFTDRPAFAANPSQAGAVVTPYGAFNPAPAGGNIIPRNFGQGPGFVSLNMRFGRTFGFGPSTGHSHHVHLHSTNHRYNLTLSVMVRNIFNRTNPGIPVGNLSSPLFNQSNWLASSSGPYDPAYGNNRRLMFELRLNF